jgi:hypothetical protein
MDAHLHVLAPSALVEAVKEAAMREMTNTSEYVRRTLLQRLRADGLDPVQFAPRSDAA